MLNVNLNLYRFFLAVMEQGTVTKAAHFLGVSQPTVTYNLQELERAVGGKLFMVGRHGVVPSALARELYRAVKNPYRRLLGAIERVSR